MGLFKSISRAVSSIAKPIEKVTLRPLNDTVGRAGEAVLQTVVPDGLKNEIHDVGDKLLPDSGTGGRTKIAGAVTAAVLTAGASSALSATSAGIGYGAGTGLVVPASSSLATLGTGTAVGLSAVATPGLATLGAGGGLGLSLGGVGGALGAASFGAGALAVGAANVAGTAGSLVNPATTTAAATGGVVTATTSAAPSLITGAGLATAAKETVGLVKDVVGTGAALVAAVKPPGANTSSTDIDFAPSTDSGGAVPMWAQQPLTAPPVVVTGSSAPDQSWLVPLLLIGGAAFLYMRGR